MARKAVMIATFASLAGSLAWAQDPRVELSGAAGWIFSDGVTRRGDSGPAANAIEPKDAFSWGARLGVNLNPNVEVGLLFNWQSTTVEEQFTGVTSELGEMSVYNYHGYFAYNFGDSDAQARAYVLGGLGATQYGTYYSNRVRSDIGSTRFSTTWAVGLKLFASAKVGMRLEGRWTPTHLESDREGWWCDLYLDCFADHEPQYSNQFELSGGLMLRF